jgi:hypothetical protein
MKLLLIAVALMVTLATAAHADTIGFVSRPSTNSTDFAAFVGSLGQSVSTLDFETHPFGALQSDFYSSQGVTLRGAGNMQIVSGPGPGQGNTSNPPLSSGEGVHPDSKFLFVFDSPATLTVSFANPVAAAGLFTVDLFDPDSTQLRNDVSIEAFSGPNGTGSSLGSFSSVRFNFQRDFLYFMGVGSTAGNIGSIVFRDPVGNSTDRIGIDNIEFAATPEPATGALFISGAIGLAIRRARRRGSR